MKNVRKIKVTRDGDIDKYKTRMVVQGFSLLPNDEYYDSYSSVIGAGNTRTLMYIATQTGEELSSADVGNAFLEADLPEDEVVFVEQHLLIRGGLVARFFARITSLSLFPLEPDFLRFS